MSDRQTSSFTTSTLHKPADPSTKNVKVTHEMVVAIADRIYGMLLRELKIERERQRVLNGSQRQ